MSVQDTVRSIRLEKTSTTAVLPTKAHRDDAGYDLYVDEERWLWPFQGADISTGWRVKVPVGCWGSLKNRSSTFTKRGIKIYEGVIDSGYTGPLKIVLQNMNWWPIKIRRGDRLAQLIVIRVVETEIWEVTQSLDSEGTTRGQQGFGSSGR